MVMAIVMGYYVIGVLKVIPNNYEIFTDCDIINCQWGITW